MIKRLLTAFIAAGIVLGQPAYAQRELGIFALDPVDDGNTVLALDGNGIVTRAADMALFSAGVTTTGDTAEEALRANAKKMQSVLAAARALGVADKDIQTSTTSVRPVMSDNRRQVAIYQSFAGDAAEGVGEAAVDAIEAAASATEEKPQAPRIVGYTAVNVVTIKQRDLANFGKTIDRLVAAGANRVNGPNFKLVDSSSSEQEARTLAIKDARERAVNYAEAADLKVVRIIMIGDGRISGLSSRSQNEFGLMQAVEYDASYYETPVSSGELNITARVSMMFELEPK